MFLILLYWAAGISVLFLVLMLVLTGILVCLARMNGPDLDHEPLERHADVTLHDPSQDPAHAHLSASPPRAKHRVTARLGRSA